MVGAIGPGPMGVPTSECHKGTASNLARLAKTSSRHNSLVLLQAEGDLHERAAPRVPGVMAIPQGKRWSCWAMFGDVIGRAVTRWLPVCETAPFCSEKAA